MRRILIVKTGASGDVARSTLLLRVLEDEIFWITDPYQVPLFPDNHPRLTLLSSKDIPEYVLEQDYELVFNLEEDEELVKKISQVSARKWTGIYWDGDAIRYTPDAADWFDMSLLSTLGLEEADRRKFNNTRTFQDLLLGMIGKPFNNEEYLVYHNPNVKRHAKRVALETTAGPRWPNKVWTGYDEIADRLRARGYEPFILKRREHLRDYMADIQSCSCLISGDTLGMHLGIGYGLACISLFSCTNHHEIHDYGRVTKIVSPLIDRYLYTTTFSQEAVSAIPVDAVWDAFLSIEPTLSAKG